jgi:hypothetical protein
MRWGLGIEPLDHEVSVAIGLLHRSIALAPPASGAHEALGRHLAALHKTRSQVGALQALDRRFWEAAAQSAPPTNLIGHLRGWADRWPFWSEDEDLEGIARRLELARHPLSDCPAPPSCCAEPVRGAGHTNRRD